MKIYDERGVQYGTRHRYDDKEGYVPGYHNTGYGIWFSGSCGARYVEEFGNEEDIGVGITLAPGFQGEEKKTEKEQIKHITCKNGTFTVRTKYCV